MSGKGAATRERILDRAFRLAGQHGIEGVSLNMVAEDLGLSKSGLFAHFRSKEELSVEILRTTADRFTDDVIRPALTAPRGEPRIAKLFANWLAWLNDPALPGGCPMVAASIELDDKTGAARDYLVTAQAQLRATMAKAAQIAIDEGHFREDLDPEQFSFELMGLMLAYNHAHRLLRDKRARPQAKRAFERLLETSRA